VHEVAALIFAVLCADACGARTAEALPAPSARPVDAAAGALDARYLEHDAASLFAAVLAGGDGAGEAPGMGLSLYYEDAAPAAPGQTLRPAPVQGALTRIWAALAVVDAQLHAHLTRCGVEPQLFLLKWLRLLFGREFHFDDAVVVWDALISASADGFAAGRRPGELVEAMCVAMLAFLRPQLLAAPDFGAVLRRLQKFPPVEHVGDLVERAISVSAVVSAVARKPAPPISPGLAPPPPGGAATGLGFAVPPRRAAPRTPGDPLQGPAEAAGRLRDGAVVAVSRIGAGARAAAAALEEEAEIARAALVALPQRSGAELSHALGDIQAQTERITTDLNAALGSIKAGAAAAAGDVARGANDVGRRINDAPAALQSAALSLLSRLPDGTDSPRRDAGEAAALVVPIEALEGLLGRMRARGDAAEDAAALASALLALRAIHGRLART